MAPEECLWYLRSCTFFRLLHTSTIEDKSDASIETASLFLPDVGICNQFSNAATRGQ